MLSITTGVSERKLMHSLQYMVLIYVILFIITPAHGLLRAVILFPKKGIVQIFF